MWHPTLVCYKCYSTLANRLCRIYNHGNNIFTLCLLQKLKVWLLSPSVIYVDPSHVVKSLASSANIIRWSVMGVGYDEIKMYDKIWPLLSIYNAMPHFQISVVIIFTGIDKIASGVALFSPRLCRRLGAVNIELAIYTLYVTVT